MPTYLYSQFYVYTFIHVTSHLSLKHTKHADTPTDGQTAVQNTHNQTQSLNTDLIKNLQLKDFNNKNKSANISDIPLCV